MGRALWSLAQGLAGTTVGKVGLGGTTLGKGRLVHGTAVQRRATRWRGGTTLRKVGAAVQRCTPPRSSRVVRPFQKQGRVGGRSKRQRLLVVVKRKQSESGTNKQPQ